MYKNFKNIERTVFGRGSLSMMEEILQPVRKTHNRYIVFIVDDFFRDSDMAAKLPVKSEDVLRFIDVDPHEPTTELIDTLRDEIIMAKG